MPISRRQFLATTALAAHGAWAAESPPHPAPNIVFIMADDLGWGDLSCYGNNDFATPALDALAAAGQRLTQAYANSPVCSASRTALITGRYQYRLRVGLEEPIQNDKSPYGLPPDVPTLPGLLRNAGYRTALVGKWHLGYGPKFGPRKSGYDSFYGNQGGGVDYFTHKESADADAKPDLWDGEQRVEQQGYYTDLLTERALKLLRAQADTPADKPLFLSLHYTAPHWPWEGPMDEAASRELKSLIQYDGGSLAIYGRMVQAMDAGIGRVMAELKRSGLGANTLVVFTSDNGGERFSRTWPLTGQKTELLEGGIRVPALVSWPGHLQPGVSQQVAITMDWLPTLLAAAGAPPLENADGTNLLPLLTGEQPQGGMPRTLYWRYKAHGQRALRDGDLKYLRIKGNEFLFDLAADVHERANRAKLEPERLAALRKAWEAWEGTMLPITPDVFTHSLRGDRQADRYGVTNSD